MGKIREACPTITPNVAPAAEYGGDPETEPRNERVPTLGDPAKAQWHVLVRHSPFLLKQAWVHGATADEARALFLEAVKQRHEDVANRQRGPNRDRDAKRVRDSYLHGLREQNTYHWTIRPASEVRKEHKQLRERRVNVWGPRELQSV